MAQSKTDVGSLVIVAALALIIGIGTGALLSGESGSGPGRDQPEGGQPPAEGNQAMARPQEGELNMEGIEQMLEERFQEVAAIERLAVKAEMRLDRVAAKGPGADVPPPPKPLEKVPPKRPNVIPRVVGKDVPKAVAAPTPPANPTPPPTPPAQETTSDEALKRSGKYQTELGPSPAIGPDSAPVKVFVISDFQCPVCRRAANGTHELFDEFGDDVQWIFWQNPLDMHRKAFPVAMASMAAFRQGKFWEFHDKAFQNQRAADPADLEGFARELGLDMDKFNADLTNAELEKKVRSDQAAAENIGARGTPAFLINGRLQVGWGSTAGIASMVKREQAEMTKLMESGKSLKEALEERARLNGKTAEEAPTFIAHFLQGKPAVRKEKAD